MGEPRPGARRLSGSAYQLLREVASDEWAASGVWACAARCLGLALRAHIVQAAVTAVPGRSGFLSVGCQCGEGVANTGLLRRLGGKFAAASDRRSLD